MALLEVKELTYAYPKGGRNVLDGVSLTVEKGEFVSVLGPNGSGKSTLALVLSGLRREKGGECNMSINERRRLCRIVFQNPDSQIVGETVEEDTAFGAENLLLSSDEIRLRTDKALSAVGLYEKRFDSPFSLSGGEKQRLQIAGALAMEPSLLILDEATAMLDRRAIDSILPIIRSECRYRGLSVIYITHHTEETIASDRILIMEGGRIVKSGRNRDVLTYDTLMKYSLPIPYALTLSHALGLGDLLTNEEVVEAIRERRQ